MKWLYYSLTLGVFLLLGSALYCKSQASAPITTIVQKPSQLPGLRSSHLAEILDLSRDHPTLVFDCKKGEKKLLATPWISEAKIDRIAPDTLLITYTLREPIAKIGDYQNIAIDQGGSTFPLYPYYSPKQLPEIYLGTGCEKKKYLHLAFTVLENLKRLPKQEHFSIQRIDVSHAFAESCGEREIVILAEDTLLNQEGAYHFPKILRLPIKDYAQQLNNFFSLRHNMLQEYRRQIPPDLKNETVQKFMPRTIDLRISKLAFIENEG